MTRTDSSFKCTQSLTCEEPEFKRTYDYDLKIYSSAVTPCRTNTCISTASSFGSAMVWKWRQNFVRNIGKFCQTSQRIVQKNMGLHLHGGEKPTSRNVSSEVFLLLGCYVAYVGGCLATFRGSLSVPFSVPFSRIE